MAGNFIGNGRRQVLLYDRSSGDTLLVGFDSTGLQDGWRSSWVLAAAGRFLGNGRDQLALYDRGRFSTHDARMRQGQDTPATATISGSNITLSVDAGEIKATYTGTVSGDQMSGTMVVTCAPGTGEGTWTVKKH